MRDVFREPFAVHSVSDTLLGKTAKTPTERGSLDPQMSRRRTRPQRSKTISATGVSGQKGVNLIERIVLDMESLWTPTGANEVVIDRYIELFDPTTRKP